MTKIKQIAIFLLLLAVIGLPACQKVTPAPAASPPPVESETAVPTAVSSTSAPILPLGINLGFAGGRSRAFVDAAKTLRGWEKIGDGRCPQSPRTCDTAPQDDDGWPLSDAQTLIFDMRTWGAWWSGNENYTCPNCPDGDEHVINLDGVYHLSFMGQAVISPADGTFIIQNQQYDPADNVTNAELHLPPGEELLYIRFSDTRRTADSALGSGITQLRLIRPGYPADTEQTFSDDFLAALEPFRAIRTMTWTGAPYDIPKHTDEENSLDWNERNRPEWRQPQRDGVAWEYIVELANVTGKEIWINVPIHASDDYVRGLAAFLRDNLRPDINFYVEYSNEVWNPHFDQYLYNQIAALEESLARPDSPLAADGEGDLDILGQRRYAQRNLQISRIFGEVFGDGAINGRVRIVHTWFIAKSGQVADQLAWLEANYGPPADYLYAVAGGSYFYDDNMPEEIVITEVFPRLIKASDVSAGDRLAMQEVANRFGLHHFVYEGGPDTAVQLKQNRSSQLLNTLIAAHKAPRMKDVLLHDLWNNWYNHPQLSGELFMFYDLAHVYSRWGMFGLTDDIANRETPKFEAIYALTGIAETAPPAPVTAVADASPEAIALSWSPSFAADSYLILRSDAVDGLYDNLAETSDLDYVDTAVSPGESWFYVVAAKNARGLGYSAPLTAVAETLALDDLLHIRFTDAPPIIDGTLDSLWDAAPIYAMTRLIRGEVDDTADLSGDFRALYDADNLYLFYRIHDDALRPKAGDDPWNGDSVELYLDGGNEKYVYDSNDEQYIFPLSGDVWTQHGRSQDLQFTFAETDDGYAVEIALPWRSVSVTPEHGLLIGFEAEVNDTDGSDLQRDGKLAWFADVDKAWSNPGLFGTAVLVEQ